ncbi:hypothetical protein [Micromonospora sp. DT31]|uniref:hypothetical protein n=1 Tax=Micromonospora sp. DT31 TaxID=3393434 RepID=UPI003CF0C507
MRIVPQPHPLPDPQVWTVRGMALPGALASLLRTGGWLHPGQQALHDLMPWFEDPLMFMPDLHAMRFQNAFLDHIADDSSLCDLFRMTRGSRSGHPLGLPWLDVDQAVFIAVNEYAGDDVALALDYRTDPADPRVVASDFWTDPRQCSWRTVAPTFTDLLTALQAAWSARSERGVQQEGSRSAEQCADG